MRKKDMNINNKTMNYQFNRVPDPQKILIEALHGLGDVVSMLPMIREVRDRYPNAEITVLVNKAMVADILTCANIKIDFCTVFDIHGNFFTVLRQCAFIRKKGFDIAIASANTPVLKSKVFMMLIHPKNKVGIQFKYDKNFDKLEDKMHFAEANLMAIEDLVINQHGYMPRLFSNKQLLHKMRQEISFQKEDIVIGVCIGQADLSYRNKLLRRRPIYTRGWGNYNTHIHNMEVLIGRILQEGWKVILLGGRNEKRVRSSLLHEIVDNENVKDMVGKTTLAESIALADICNIVVGVDTGMQHIADAVGTKSVSIFGPTNPKTHGAYSDKAVFAEADAVCKYCYGTSKYLKCTDRKCMHRITPERVFKLIYESIQKD